MKDNLYIPQMLLIGSTGRNGGKTTLAAEVVRQWKNKFSIIGLKVTTIQKKDGECPRGGEGCGVCSSLKGNFEVLEEIDQNANKDTSILLAAGAVKVYWLKALRTHIYEGIKDFMANVPENTLIICESNSLRNAVTPGGFIMLNNTGNAQVKISAGEVMNKADIIIDYDVKNNINTIIERIEVDKIQSYLVVKIKNV